jgi:hypothetical protein
MKQYDSSKRLNIEPVCLKARETDWSTESLLNVKVLLIVTL